MDLVDLLASFVFTDEFLELHHFLSFSDDSLEADFVSVVATVGATAVFVLL